MEASASKLIELLKRYFLDARLHTVYEAGFSGYALHRMLMESGIDNIVVNPGSIEVSSRDKVKTDKRDAKKLAEQLSDYRLKSIYIPSEKEERLRLLTRLRATLVKDRARFACRIKSKLFQFGYNEELVDDATASVKWIHALQGIEYFDYELKYVIDYLCKQWLQLTQDLTAINKEIAKQSKNDERLGKLEEIYKSFPGIGNTSAKELSRELGTLSQFSSNKQAYSYIGLTPSESSSGEKRRQGGISHCGRPRLRHLLIEIAWRHTAKDVGMNKKFVELSHRRGKKRAIVAVARILIGRLRCCLMKSALYEPQGEFIEYS